MLVVIQVTLNRVDHNISSNFRKMKTGLVGNIVFTILLPIICVFCHWKIYTVPFYSVLHFNVWLHWSFGMHSSVLGGMKS